MSDPSNNPNNPNNLSKHLLVLQPGQVSLPQLRSIWQGEVRLAMHADTRAGIIAAQ